MGLPQLARYSFVCGGQLTWTSPKFAKISETFVPWVVRLARGRHHNKEKWAVDMDRREAPNSSGQA